jgi:hypothetical protein
VGVGAGVFVLGGVGAAVVGAAVGAAVVAAALGVAVGVGLGVALALGASVVGAAVRIWTVGLGDADADGLALGDGELVAPAKRDRPPPSITPISRSVTRPPATAARIRSIQRGPRRGGGMIFVVSDMGRANRRLRAEQTSRNTGSREGLGDLRWSE